MNKVEFKIRLLLGEGKFNEALDYAKRYRKWLIENKKENKDQEIAKTGKIFYEAVKDYHKKFKYQGIDSIDAAVNLEKEMFDFYFLCNKKTYTSLSEQANYAYEYGKLYDSLGEEGKAFKAYEKATECYQKAKNLLHNLNQKDTIEKISKIQVDITERQYEIFPNRVNKANMYENRIKAYPNDVLPKVHLALAYLEDGKLEKTSKLLSSINYEPMNFDLIYLYFKLDLIYSRFDDAINRANRMLTFPEVTDNLVLLIIDLIKLYIRKSDFEDAYNLLNTYYNKFKDNSDFIMELVNFYIVTENYIHALFIIEKHYDVVKSNKNLNDILFYLRVKLGLKKSTSTNELEPSTYKQRQIIDYSKDEFIKEYERKHKNKNRTDSNLISLEGKATLETLYDLVKEKLEGLIPNTRGIFDTYVVDIDKNWGVYNSNKTSVFMVETLGDGNIVTVEPVNSKYSVSEKRKEKEMS